MTGQKLIDYIKRNKLEDHECLEDFEVVLQVEIMLRDAPEFITEKEALKLREEIGEVDE